MYIPGSHVGECDEYCLLGCPDMYYVNFQGSRFYCLQFECLAIHSSTTGSQCIARQQGHPSLFVTAGIKSKC